MAQEQVSAEGVVVTKLLITMNYLTTLFSATLNIKKNVLSLLCLILSLLFIQYSEAAVLADDRADVMTHYYSGGDVTAQGPALLVRKGNDKSYSIFASYYVDNVTSASIDVKAQASEYSEKRDDLALGFDYLYNDTITSISFNSSEESDYLSDTVNIDMAQEFFGGTTTFNIGYSNALDTVKRVDNDFSKELNRYRYRLGMSQILTPNWISSFNYEAIAEKGYLSNPYRSARVLGAYVPELSPDTRTSEAYSVRSLTYFDWRGSLRFDYRAYTDTWGIQSDTFEVGVSKYIGAKSILEVSYRLYSQTKANFYSDNFGAEMVYMARDKELSTFTDTTIKAKYTYHMFENDSGFFSKGTFTSSIGLIEFEYDDFTHYQTGEKYSYKATVSQILLSLWY